MIIEQNDPILVTGASGFIGSRVVKTLLDFGFADIRCLVRPSSDVTALAKVIGQHAHGKVTLLRGNLLSRSDCEISSRDATVVYHLAAGMDKSYAGAFMNSVVTTRNLLDALLGKGSLKRFVNVSSFSVYSNQRMKRHAWLDESCDIEHPPHGRADAYTYAKIKQDEMIRAYGKEYKLPFVIVRPGAVYGPGKGLTGRVGIDTFGLFLHLGGKNQLPLSYVDNCAEAIVLAGLVEGVNGEVFNVVDDELPRSKDLLRLYKKKVASFRSISLPYSLTYFLSTLWEKYAAWSQGQLPPAFNRSRCTAQWKGNRYSNQKLKQRLGWRPRVSFEEAIDRSFTRHRELEKSA